MKIPDSLYNELYESLSVQTESGMIYPDADDIREVIDIVLDYYNIDRSKLEQPTFPL